MLPSILKRDKEIRLLTWRKNLPARKRGLVADAGGGRYWIHRHEGHGIIVYQLTYRLPGDEVIQDYGYEFRRLKDAKAIASRVAEVAAE